MSPPLWWLLLTDCFLSPRDFTRAQSIPSTSHQRFSPGYLCPTWHNDVYSSLQYFTARPIPQPLSIPVQSTLTGTQSGTEGTSIWSYHLRYLHRFVQSPFLSSPSTVMYFCPFFLFTINPGSDFFASCLCFGPQPYLACHLQSTPPLDQFGVNGASVQSPLFQPCTSVLSLLFLIWFFLVLTVTFLSASVGFATYILLGPIYLCARLLRQLLSCNISTLHWLIQLNYKLRADFLFCNMIDTANMNLDNYDFLLLSIILNISYQFLQVWYHFLWLWILECN